MKRLIKSIAIFDTTVRIVTKSNKVIEYKFNSQELANNYYKDIVQ